MDLIKQEEEIATLAAIYGEEFQVEDAENKAYSIKIISSTNSELWIKLYIKFPETYPTLSPPTFEISAPHIKQSEKQRIRNILQNIYLGYVGQIVIYQWIEGIRDVLNLETSKIEENECVNKEFKKPIINTDVNFPCPLITHGEIIVDRKSSFQGHAASVLSVNQVRDVISRLKENRKINQAKHNIYAYRIYNENTKTFMHDCDDDGEHQAGSRLLHLLEIMNAKNVLVVVSRWYGGIHLGPDRFRHINNAARQVLSTANLIPIAHK